MFSSKTADVLANLAQKTARVQQSGLTPQQEAASAARGHSFGGPGEDAYDFINNPTETAGFVGAFDQLNRDRRAPRSGVRAVTDTGLAAVGGAVQGLTALASIPDNFVFGGELGTAGFARDVSGIQEALTSDGQNTRNQAYGALRDADSRELDRLGVTGLDRIVADAGSTADLMFENVSQLPQGVANAAGSFLVGGVASKGAKLAVKGVEAGIKSSAVRSFLGKYGDEIAGAAGMGSMEAGGAGLQASQAVMEMNHEQLTAGSDFYNTYLQENGDTPRNRNDARQAAAVNAARVSTVVQAPLALAGGALTGKIAANPFSAGSIKHALANVGKETLEEAVQEGAGNFSSNLGVRSFADRDQSLIEGVGAGITEGAVFGALSTGGMQLPGATARSAVSGVVQANQAILARGERINAQNKVNDNNNTAAAVKTAIQPVDAEGFSEADIQEQEAHAGVLTELQNDFRFDPAAYEPLTQAELDVVSSLDPEADNDIFEVMTLAADKMSDKTIDEDDKMGLALMITGLMDRVTDNHYQKINELVGQVTPGGALAKSLISVIDAQEKISSNQMVRETLEAAFKSASVKVDDVEDISTPEGSKAAQVALNKAIFSPETIDPEVVERLLRHSDAAPDGEKPFSAKQIAALRTKSLLNKTVTATKAEAERLGLEVPGMVRVADEAQVKKLRDSGAAGPSVMGHYETVTQLAEYGLVDDAKAALEEFQSFAQHMANKLGAVNASHVSRKGRANTPADYQAYSRSGGWHTGTVEIRSQVPKQVAFGQQVGLDARYVVESFNELAQTYPELGVKPVEQVDLHPDLAAGPAKFVAEQTLRVRDKAELESQRAPKQEAPKENPAPVKEAEPVEQPEKTEVAQVVETKQPAKGRAYTAEQVAKASDRVIQDQIEILEGRLAFEGSSLMDDAANLKLLKAERDSREDALFEEAKADEPQPTPSEADEEVTKSEAQPETEVTEETAEEEAKAPTIQEVFPDLIQDTNGEQLLLNGFSLDGANKTRLLGENPLTVDQIVAALTDGEAFNKLTGFSASKISPLVSQAYLSVLGLVNTRVFDVMAGRLLKAKNFEEFREGKDPTNRIRTTSLRLLNLMSRDASGTLVFNEKVQYAAVLAFSDWLAQNSVASPARDKEEIAKALGIDITAVTDELAQAFNGGITSSQAVMGLTRKLEQFLGLKVKGDTPLGLSRGIIMSLAGELLASAHAEGLVQRIANSDSAKTFNFYSVDKKALGLVSNTEEGPKFGGQTTLIEQIITQDESVAGYTLNEPARKVSPTLQHGGAPQTKEQDATQVRENEVPHTVNRAVLGIYQYLGGQNLLNLFGNGILSETMNKNDRLAKESQNLSLIAAFEAITGMVDHMQREAKATDRELEEIQAFREYLFSSVNRMQQQGSYGDQSSKLTREAITPYGGTLDLTDPDMLSMWRRGLAQGLGIKVEIQSDETWDTNLSALLEKEAVQTALAQLQKYEDVPAEKLVEALQAALDPKGKKGISPVQVHALKSYADYLVAEDHSEFYTHVYVEADGKTDGPTNSLIYMRLGGYDLQMVQSLRRGGIEFDKRAVPLHEYYDTPEKPGDTYEIAAKKTALGMKTNAVRIFEAAQDAQQVVNLKEQANATVSLLQTLIGGLDFSYEDGVFTIGRGQLKNPMTVTVYGSSANGIANKIAKELIGHFYEEVSKANALATEFGTPNDWLSFLMYDESDVDAGSKRAAELIGALTALTTKKVGVFDGKYYVSNAKGAGMPSLVSAQKLTFNKEAVKALSSSIKHFYVAPMVTAISAEMGSSVAGSELIQGTTNVMSMMAKAAFTKLFNAELDKADNKSDGISPNQIKTILNKVSFLFPYMEGDTVTVNVKGLEMGTISPEGEEIRSAATLTSSLSTQLEIPMPAQAGVAGAAYVNISYGDGRMIIKASPNLVGGRLHVFDGINVALKDARKNGEAINQSVLEAIQTGTPFQDLLKAFHQLTETLNFDMFNDQDYADIFSSLAPEGIGTDDPKGTVQVQIKVKSTQLEEAALDEQARLNVMARVHLSSDHMAALNAPASTAGQGNREDLSQLPSLQDVANRLHEIFLEERAQLVEDKKKAEANPPKEDLGSTFDVLPQAASGMRETNTYRLREMLDGLNIPLQQKQMARRALLALKNQKWTVALGSREQANAYAKEKGIPFQFGEADHGLTAPARKLVIVANNSSETLAHELIHAATIDRVEAFYADPSSLDQASHDAIERLDALMIEWLTVAEEASALRHPEAQEAVWAATRTIVALLNQGDQAGALNEFMAWNLANQELVKLNSTIKVESRLAKIARSVAATLRNLFGLPFAGSDMNSNIRFNTMLLMSPDLPSIQSVTADRMLQHSTKTRPDLDEIVKKMAIVVARADKGFEKMIGSKPSELAMGHALQLSSLASQHGFHMTGEERVAFTLIVAAYRIEQMNDPAAHIKLDRYYRELLAQMKQSTMMTDPNSTDPGELAEANDRISLLDGSTDVGTDSRGRSMLVPMFVALGATNAVAQKLFNRVEVRDQKTKRPVTADEFARTAASRAVDTLMDFSLGFKPNQKIAEEVQNLVAGIVSKVDKEQGLLMQTLNVPSEILFKANRAISDTMAKGLGKASDAIPQVNAVTEYAKLSLDFLNKDRAEDALHKLTSKIDETDTNQNIRAFWAEMLGMTEGNQDILELVKKARAVIHRVRQGFRKVMPATIAKKFSRKLEAADWAALHKMGQADLSVLLDQGMNTTDIVELMADPAAVTKLMAQKEADIQKLFQGQSKEVLSDAWALSDIMLGRPRRDTMTKRNALAIANRVGSNKVGTYDWSSPEVKAVEAYISLMVLNNTPKAARDILTDLSKKEKAGVAFTLSLISEAKSLEMAKVPDHLKYNIQKGYMPKERKGSFKAVMPDQVNDYTRAGYRVVGSRMRGGNEHLHDAKSKDMIYVATDLSAPSYKQGIMQNVRSTVFGLNATSGAQFDTPAAGIITDPSTVKRLIMASLKSGTNDGLLSPLYDADGQIYAFEKLIDLKDINDALETQENAAVAVSHWMGRLHEELHAEQLNDVLIERLSNMFDTDDAASKSDEYYDLFEEAKTNPVIADALSMMNDRDIAKVKAKMGNKFMVRKSLYENVVGYRTLSVGDMWTGNNKLSEESRDAFANYMTGLLGPEAYRRLTMAEQGWANLMGDARVGIVVKSMLVPALNGMANFYQLMMNGIGPITIARQSALKLRETHLYMQNELRYQELSNELAGAKGAKRPDHVRRIETELRKIEDLNQRLSIWPLIEMGELTQVTEGLTNEDMELSKGRIWDHISKAADKLPPALKTAGRYAIVAKDTALFEGLARTVAYTDFVAKAVLYDHLVQKEKLDRKTVQRRIANEFVNYDLMGGRVRARAEEMGLIWFWAYKLRIGQTAVSLLRNNPLYALLTSQVPGVDLAGTPVDDNMGALIADGRFWNSFGPENSLRALSLNPINQIIN